MNTLISVQTVVLSIIYGAIGILSLALLIVGLQMARLLLLDTKPVKFLIHLFSSTKNKARREAQTDFEALMNQIKFAGTMPRIYVLQDDVLDYHNTWSAIIDYETLTLFVGALYKSLSERETMVQNERNKCYKGKSIYN